MPPHPTHTQPSMFAPEELPYDALSLRLDIHLDGPTGRAETWVTLSDQRGEQLACYGPDRTTVDAAVRGACSEVLQDALRSALRQLSPF